MTNGDKIRKEINEMSYEELAHFLRLKKGRCSYCIYKNQICFDNCCTDGIKKFLEKKSRKERILE